VNAAPALKKPRGRPVGTGKGRTARLELSVTPDGKATALRLAEAAGLSVSEWIEQCVLREQRRQTRNTA
jgi:hypothetical protein